jgi:alpha-L-fucosidase
MKCELHTDDLSDEGGSGLKSTKNRRKTRMTAKQKDEASAVAFANAVDGAGVSEGGVSPERLTWLQDAGFGMFIHWSVDSQLGCGR